MEDLKENSRINLTYARSRYFRALNSSIVFVFQHSARAWRNWAGKMQKMAQSEKGRDYLHSLPRVNVTSEMISASSIEQLD